MITLLSSTENTLLSILIIVIAVGLSYLFYRFIRKESKRFKKDHYESIDDIATFEDLESLVKFKMSTNHQVYFSLLYISIDQFDQVSEYIHPDGVSKFLEKFANLIHINLKRGSKFAQTQERETFLVYIPELLNEEQLMDIAVSFKKTVEKKININSELSIHRTVTVAATTYPNHGTTLESLYLNLRSALYLGKRNGGNTISIYNDSLKQTEELLKYYKEMKTAFKEQRILINFNPIFDNEGLKCYGMESIITYKKEGNERLEYRDFMAILETTNDALWVGKWIYEKSIEHSLDVNNLTKNKEFYTFIPVSLMQLESSDCVTFFDSIARKYQVEQNKIVLYIPLAQTIAKTAFIVKNIMALKKIGFKVAVDYQIDESHLKQVISNFQVDFLKIKESVLESKFEKIKNEFNDVALIGTHIINVDQLNEAKKMNVSFLQGEYFGQALNKDELFPYISKNRL